jgi:uncharacterized membrane protein
MMMLLVLLAAILAGVLIASLLGAPTFRDGRGRTRWVLALIYIGFGVIHLVFTNGLLPIMPPFLPYPREIVWFTGVCEIAGGIGLLTPATRRWAGWALAAYAVCVFPANLYHAFGHVAAPGLPSSWWYHGPRLLFQPVFVWWALYAGEVIDWPFSPHRPAFAREQSEAAKINA